MPSKGQRHIHVRWGGPGRRQQYEGLSKDGHERDWVRLYCTSLLFLLYFC
jgi:hypothetical protein